MRAAALLPLVLLAACASTAGEANPGTYTLGRGIVNYDEMRRAKAQCEASGGVVRPIDAGGDPNQMSNYECVIGRKEKAQ